MTMPGELDHEPNGVSKREPWDRVVVDAAPRDHIVQLYQDQDFLNRAVCRFAGAAIANGKGLIPLTTLPFPYTSLSRPPGPRAVPRP